MAFAGQVRQLGDLDRALVLESSPIGINLARIYVHPASDRGTILDHFVDCYDSFASEVPFNLSLKKYWPLVRGRIPIHDKNPLLTVEEFEWLCIAGRCLFSFFGGSFLFCRCLLHGCLSLTGCFRGRRDRCRCVRCLGRGFPAPIISQDPAIEASTPVEVPSNAIRDTQSDTPDPSAMGHIQISEY